MNLSFLFVEGFSANMKRVTERRNDAVIFIVIYAMVEPKG